MLSKTTLAALVVGLAIISPLDTAVAAGGMERIQKQKKIRVGFTNVKPWAFRDSTGVLRGIETDIALEILKPLGIGEIETIGTEFAGLIPGLQAGRFDMSNTGLYITPQRCKLVVFSDPYLRVGDGLLVQKGNPKKIHSYQDIIDNPDLKVATSRGAINAQNMMEAGIPQSRITLLSDSPSLISALTSGRIDAASLSRGAVAGFMLDPNIKGLEVAKPFKGLVLKDGTEKKGHAAFAFRQGDEDLAQAFNKGLAELKASGKLQEILVRYGFEASDAPLDVTAESLCKS